MTSAGVRRFSFHALASNGTATEGEVAAESLSAAHARLASDGLWVTSIAESAGGTAATRRLSVADAALLLELLGGLLEAHLSVARALAALEPNVPARCRRVVADTRAAVTEGHGLGASLERAARFAPEVLALVRAGEASGALAASVRDAAGMLAQRLARQRAIRAALAYPALLLVSSASSVVLLVAIVLPRFSAMLGELNQELPPVTRFVLRAANAGTLLAPVLLAVAATSVAMVWRLRRTPAGRRRVDELLLRAPGIGSLRFASASARASVTFGTLLQQGLKIGPALRLAATAAGDAALQSRFERAGEQIVRGTRPSRAFATTGALTARAAHLIAAGEESGQLGAMAVRAGRLDAEWVDRRIAVMLRVVEPGLIIGFAVIVGTLAAAMLQAVYAIRPGP